MIDEPGVELAIGTGHANGLPGKEAFRYLGFPDHGEHTVTLMHQLQVMPEIPAYNVQHLFETFVQVSVIRQDHFFVDLYFGNDAKQPSSIQQGFDVLFLWGQGYEEGE